MFPRVIILEDLHTRLLGLKKGKKGAVYGILFDKTMLLVGMAILDDATNNLFPNGSSVQVHFPTGIDFCGAFAVSDEYQVPDNVWPILKDVMVTDNPVYIRKTRAINEVVAFLSRNEQASQVTFTVMSQSEYNELFATIYMPLILPLSGENSKGSIFNAFDELLSKMGNGDMVFQIDGTDPLIANEFSEIPTTDSAIEDLYKVATKKYLHLTKQSVLQVSMFYSAYESAEKAKDNHNLYSYKMKACSYKLPITALCVTPKKRKIGDCYGLLIDTVCRSIHLYKFEMERRGETAALKTVRQYNFSPPSLGHYFSAVYNNRDMDYEIRQQYHTILGLSMERPIFKIANSIHFKSDPYQKSPLMDVHEGVELTDKIDGQKYLVSGHYEYYHYLQQNVDDDGWGCAYRSLQTLFSWFRLQGYTSVDVPSLRDIQDTLVKLGDKPAEFVGSRTWIGSTEVAFVLEHYLKIPSKIVSVPIGQDMSTISEDLVAHFEIHGTPVMVGGGVLAHTILGINYNKHTKEVRYLVLDPHYTGMDDLKIIQGKGWVSWKSKSFWKLNQFQNLCLPLRLRLV